MAGLQGLTKPPWRSGIPTAFERHGLDGRDRRRNPNRRPEKTDSGASSKTPFGPRNRRCRVDAGERTASENSVPPGLHGRPHGSGAQVRFHLRNNPPASPNRPRPPNRAPCRNTFVAGSSRWGISILYGWRPGLHRPRAQTHDAEREHQVIKSLVTIAQTRGWSEISVRGTERFRKETWFAARMVGLEVRGFQAERIRARAPHPSPRPAERDPVP